MTADRPTTGGGAKGLIAPSNARAGGNSSKRAIRIGLTGLADTVPHGAVIAEPAAKDSLRVAKRVRRGSNPPRRSRQQNGVNRARLSTPLAGRQGNGIDKTAFSRSSWAAKGAPPPSPLTKSPAPGSAK